MTASPARRTFALDGLQGASLNPCTEPGEGIRGYTLITSVACVDTQSIGKSDKPMRGMKVPVWERRRIQALLDERMQKP
jgi:hypothetical protein